MVGSASANSIKDYEDTIKGNLIRGNEPIREDLKLNEENNKFELETPGTDDLLVTGIQSGNSRIARVGIKEKNKEL
jgi:hypothetical protein